MITLQGTKNKVLFEILKKEFRQKYNWSISNQHNYILLQTSTPLFFKVNNNDAWAIQDQKQKKISNINAFNVRSIIYQLYFQNIIMKELESKIPKSVFPLFLSCFFKLSSFEIFYYLE